MKDKILICVTAMATLNGCIVFDAVTGVSAVRTEEQAKTKIAEMSYYDEIDRQLEMAKETVLEISKTEASAFMQMPLHRQKEHFDLLNKRITMSSKILKASYTAQNKEEAAYFEVCSLTLRKLQQMQSDFSKAISEAEK